MQNQIAALAVLPKLSERQLIQALQANDGTLPTYALMAELQARKKRSAAFAGEGGPPKTSVKQDMMAQAQPMGLQSLAPQAMAQAPMVQGAPQGMAEGGQVSDWRVAARDREAAKQYGYAVPDSGPYPNLMVGPRDYGRNPGAVFGGDQSANPFVPWGTMAHEESLRAPFTGDKYLRRINKAAHDRVLNIKEAEREGTRYAGGGQVRFDDGGLTYVQRLRAQGLNPWWGSVADYFQNPNRTPILDSGSWKPAPVPPQDTAPASTAAAYGPNSGWAQGTTTAPDIAIPPPYTDTPDINIAQPKTGSGGIRSVTSTAPAAYTPKEIKYGDIAAERAKNPQGTAIPEGLADYKSMLGDMKADREQNKWLALAQMGATMATTPGSLGRAAGAGAEVGLQGLAKNNAVNREQQVQAMRERGMMGIAQDRQLQMNEQMAREAVRDQAHLGISNEQLQQRAAEAAAHNATQLDVARIGLQGHMAQVGAFKQAQIEAGRERMMQMEYAKAVEEARKQLAPNMKYMDPTNGAALLQRDAEQAALQRMRMMKDAEKYFVFPQERAAPGFVTPPANGPMRAPIG